MSKKIYKITESQMKTILENKKGSKDQISESELKAMLNEMDNHNYPMGSDNSSAPWNSDGGPTKSGEYVRGSFSGVGYDDDEMILLNKSTNKYYYTINDAVEEDGEDIYDTLADYLDIPQMEDEDEDGKYLVAIDDWKHHIDQDEILHALSSYLNLFIKSGENIPSTTDTDVFERGDAMLLEITPESIEFIDNPKLESMVKFK